MTEPKDPADERYQAWLAKNPAVQELLLSSREKTRKRQRAWGAKNKNKSREQSRAWRARNPDRAYAYKKEYRSKNTDRVRVWERRSHLRTTYGITLEQRDGMLDAQGGCCAACGGDDPHDKRGWHIDHCHSSGAVRGVLCSGCNVALGHAKEDATRLRALADYIEKVAINA